jgi:hypothetical protein
MAVRFTVAIDGDAWQQMIRSKQRSVINAAVLALRETADNAVTEGRRNIAAAGRFGANWQRDLQFRMSGRDIKTVATVFHKSALAGIFESGATIRGKPRLWIPITPGAPPIKRSGKRLTFAIVGGHHLAFDKDDRDRKRRPLYIGVSIVHIRKLWRITEIVREQLAHFAAVFSKFFVGG